VYLKSTDSVIRSCSFWGHIRADVFNATESISHFT